MPGLTHPRAVPPPDPAREFSWAARPGGLRLLATLVQDTLAATLRAPMLATAGGPLPGGGPMWQSTLGATRSTAPTPQGRAAGAARAVTDLAPAGDQGPDGDRLGSEMSTDSTLTVEADHVETWQLVQRAQAGDGEAFGQLYDRYVDTVFRFIYFRVNDRALAEDFTSETFLRALRRIGTISYQGRDIGAWFVTIARNIVLDHVKSARHRLESPTADTIEGREHQPSTEAAVLDSLQSERLMAAIAQLGDEQRECVTLRFVQGMSVSETAAIMGKNDGAVKALQHRAVRKLAELVGSELR